MARMDIQHRKIRIPSQTTKPFRVPRLPCVDDGHGSLLGNIGGTIAN